MRPSSQLIPPSLRVLPAIALLTVAALPAQTMAAVFKSVHTRHMEAGQFQYIGEFFSGKERADNRVLLRTDAEERAGLYFIAELMPRLLEIPPGASLVADVIRSDSNEIHTHTFPLPTEPARSRIIYLGLTGGDWPEGERRLRPVAWRLRLMDSNGAPVDTWSSFLWEMP